MVTHFKNPLGGGKPSGTAPPVLVRSQPDAQVASNIKVLWDFDGDGDWSESIEDITSYVLSCESLTGRDYPSTLTGVASPGTFSATLDNTDDRFSFFNTSSPLNASPYSLKTGRRVRVEMADRTTTSREIFWVGATAGVVADNASVVPTVPPGTIAGDLMVVTASIRGTGATVSTPAGWTVLLSVASHLKVFGKFAVGGDANPTVSFTGGAAGDTTMAQMSTYRHTGTDIATVVSTTSTQTNTSAQNIAFPAHTISETGALTIVGFWKQDDSTVVLPTTTMTANEGFLYDGPADTSSTTGNDATMGTDLLWTWDQASVAAMTATVTGGAAAISKSFYLTLLPGDRVLSSPTVLAIDSFRRADSADMATTEDGKQWTTQGGGGYSIADNRAKAHRPYNDSTAGQRIISTVDVGTTDYYAQVRTGKTVQQGFLGLVFAYVNSSNYSYVYMDHETGNIYVVSLVAGVEYEMYASGVDTYEGSTLGVRRRGQRTEVYVGGYPLPADSFDPVNGPMDPEGLPSRAFTDGGNSTLVGLVGQYETTAPGTPSFEAFAVWTDVDVPLRQCIWTGVIDELTQTVDQSGNKQASISAKGILSVPAEVKIATPLQWGGSDRHDGYKDIYRLPAGCYAGEALTRALAFPPSPVRPHWTSDVGSFAPSDGEALGLAREIERIDGGFLAETPEGGISYEHGRYRDAAPPVAWFTDTGGVGQYGYSAIEPLDRIQDIINTASARIAPCAPDVISVATQSGAGASQDIDVVVPSIVERGDLVIACIMPQVFTETWTTPPGWEENKQQGNSGGMRVYTLLADGGEAGATVRFYTGTLTGSWVGVVYVVRHWYGALDEGFEVGRAGSGASASGGRNAYPISPPGGRTVNLFLLVQGAHGGAGLVYDGLNKPPPTGYDYGSLVSLLVVGAQACGIATVRKTELLSSEEPEEWRNVFSGHTLRETLVMAVRGYEGPRAGELGADKRKFTEDGWWVTREDAESVRSHGVQRSNPSPPLWFRREFEAIAYCESVLSRYSDDHPIVAITFYPSKSAQLREIAGDLRVSQRVGLTATGRSGLGFAGQFFVESINHKWSTGTRLWETTIELSPAL